MKRAGQDLPYIMNVRCMDVFSFSDALGAPRHLSRDMNKHSKPARLIASRAHLQFNPTFNPTTQDAVTQYRWSHTSSGATITTVKASRITLTPTIHPPNSTANLPAVRSPTATIPLTTTTLTTCPPAFNSPAQAFRPLSIND